MKINLNENTRQFIKPTLCWIGIYIQDNTHREIYKLSNVIPEIPYTIVHEGIIFGQYIVNNFLKMYDNIIVRKNNQILFEKRTSHNEAFELVVENDVYDLNNNTEKEQLFKLIYYFDKDPSKIVYLKNTEEYPVIEKCVLATEIAGVASGSYLCQLARDLEVKEIRFFDYSISSLALQKELIESDNRKSVFKKYLDEAIMIIGNNDATISDIESLDYDLINTVYDYARSCKVSYLHLDLRDRKDLINLLEHVSENSYIWLSNVYYYAGSGTVNTDFLFNIIDTYTDKKNLNLFPHTRLMYEG